MKLVEVLIKLADGDAAALAKKFHETYERLAPEYGYKTRKDSAVKWADVPAKNKSLMTAVCAELFKGKQKLADDISAPASVDKPPEPTHWRPQPVASDPNMLAFTRVPVNPPKDTDKSTSLWSKLKSTANNIF